MADSERVRLSLPDLARKYPLLEEWFADPANTTAQLQGDKRLMSAREKLALFGGADQIKSNLSTVARGWRSSYIILLACRQEPMVGHQIVKFDESVGKRLSIAGLAGLYVTIDKLINEAKITRIQGLTYVVRMGGYDPNQFSLSENRSGYLTTEQGVRSIALKLERKESRGLLGGLIPVPRPR